MQLYLPSIHYHPAVHPINHPMDRFPVLWAEAVLGWVQHRVDPSRTRQELRSNVFDTSIRKSDRVSRLEAHTSCPLFGMNAVSDIRRCIGRTKNGRVLQFLWREDWVVL